MHGFNKIFVFMCLGAAVILASCSDDKAGVTAQVSVNAETLITKGSQKSRMCTACHGPAGISRVASYPSLAGKPEAYLSEQLQAFRSGTRENPMMSSIAKSLSDDDILALAHYYSSLSAAGTAEAQP